MSGAARWRWVVYLLLGVAAAATVGPWLVLLLAACGAVEAGVRRAGAARAGPDVAAAHAWPVLLAVAAAATGGLGALAWVALKVGALSYGGGFVIVPLMQGDAVDRYGWMTDGQFLNAVALGQVTPGPVIHTVTAVGYAAAGVGGGLLAAAIAFAPSFLFVLVGARRFDDLRANPGVRAFLDGAGPAAIGAILGSAVVLAAALSEAWQFAVLAGAAVLLLARAARRRADAAARGRRGRRRRAGRRAAAAMSRRLVPEVLVTEPQFRLLFAGQVLSLVGDRVMLVALPFAVLEAGGSLEAVGLVVAAELVPFLLFALVGGVLADRSDRRRVLIASDAARLAIQAVGGALLVAGRGDAGRCSACSRRCTGRPTRSSSPRSRGCCRRPCRTRASCSRRTRCAA